MDSTISSHSRPYFRLKNIELEAMAKTDLAGVIAELAFRSSRAAKKLYSAIGSNEQTRVSAFIQPKKQKQNKGPNLEAIQAKIARLRTQADSCHANRLSNTAKRLAQTMHKRMEGDRLKKQADILEAVCGSLEQFQNMTTSEVISKAQEASLYECKMISNGYHSYNIETDKPRHADAIHNTLRGLLDPQRMKREQEKAAQIQAEASLRQCDIPGFFPTPQSVISVMLEQAGDLRGKSVLEPSCGKGDLAQAALNAGASVTAFEIIPKLADYCSKFITIPLGSGSTFAIQNYDFLAHENRTSIPPYDIVLMNPPFERDAAPKHVQHALGLLKSGGRLVAVMPQNWADKASGEALLSEIDSKGYSMMEMEVESRAFAGADSFRQTGVSTSLLIINK